MSVLNRFFSKKGMDNDDKKVVINQRITISQTQSAWAGIPEMADVTFPIPKTMYAPLWGINGNIGLFNNLYVNASGKLCNGETALRTGNWDIAGSYLKSGT